MNDEEIKAEVAKIYDEIKILEAKLYLTRLLCKHKNWDWGVSSGLTIDKVRICNICGDIVLTKQEKKFAKAKAEYIKNIENKIDVKKIEAFKFNWKKTRRPKKKHNQ